jgi:hypothetical protein
MDKGKSMKPDYPMDKDTNEMKTIHKSSQKEQSATSSNKAPQAPKRTQKDAHSTTIYSETSENFQNESFFNANNYILNEVYLNDDLSLLPVVDEKTLVSCIKNKFEAKKYYVINSFLLKFT